MTDDATKRRSRRGRPVPNDYRIILGERELRVLEAIDLHGLLSSDYLFELTKDIGVNIQHLRRRLTQLYHGTCENPAHWRTPPQAHECDKHSNFLTRPDDQWDNFDADTNPCVYGISTVGKLALARANRLCPFPIPRSGWFVHDYFLACLTASFQHLAAPNEFLSRAAILSSSRCPGETRTARSPFVIKIAGDTIVPDDFFAIGYPDNRYRFIFLEADRAKEPVETSNLNASSIARKIRGYQAIFSTKLYRDLYGIPTATVAIATTGRAHAESIIRHIERNVDPAYHRRFIVKEFYEEAPGTGRAALNFGKRWVIPRKLLPVFDPWRSAAGQVDISKKALG